MARKIKCKAGLWSRLSGGKCSSAACPVTARCGAHTPGVTVTVR
jgi:hypothetical protein